MLGKYASICFTSERNDMDASLAQINARIDASLKSAGDAALANAGLTPTKAIRALWQRFTTLADRPEKIRELVAGPSGELAPDERNERDRKLALAREGATIVSRSLAARGITVPEGYEGLPYEELREQTLLERLRERGLDA